MTKMDFLVYFDQNQEFSSILTKFQIFQQFSPQAIISKNYNENRDFSKILSKIEIFANFDPGRHFFENFDYNQHFLQFCPIRDFGKFGPK